MDDPSLDAAPHRLALRGLARLNTLSAAHRPIWSALAPRARSLNRPMRLLDVATGGGDVLVALARRAARRGVAIDAVGCDISETALEIARRRAGSKGVDASFRDCNAVETLPGGFDVAICSLFLHHLNEERTVAALRRMGAAAEFVVVSDLVRSRAGLSLAWLASRMLTRSPVVHTDAIRSVRAAYTIEELRGLAEAAGLRSICIRKVWPERMILTAEGHP